MTALRVVLAFVSIAACAPSPKSPAPLRRLGEAMTEAGLRFQRIGRAALAGRWELASYDLDEMEELFERDFTDAAWQGNARMPPIAGRFRTTDVPTMKAALHARDMQALASAIAHAAKTCNDCHEAGGKPYIEISGVAGAEMPVVGTPAR